jgi:imidazolonepropionase-like amidohydrolase
MTVTVLENARLFDGLSDEVAEGATVVVEGNRIREAGAGVAWTGEAHRIDCRGMFLMPGLIDAHYHANTPSYDFHGTDRMHPALLASHAARLLTGALDRGYTTIRDAGGGDIGLKMALDAGLIDGPRFFYPGKALTQTGGHGDMRRRGDVEMCECGAYAGVITQAVDGPHEMRKAGARTVPAGRHADQDLPLGRGLHRPRAARHAAFHRRGNPRGGGGSRPAQVLRHGPLPHRRGRAALHRAWRAHDRAWQPHHCADRGAIAAAGAFVVPTLSAGVLIGANAAALGLPASTADKIAAVNRRTLEAVEACAAAGVKLGLGCDLHGDAFLQTQGRELMLRGQVQKPFDVLRSATSVNAEIVQRKGELGQVTPGALADLILVEGRPETDLSVFEHSARTVRLVLRDGQVVRDRLAA